MKTLPLENRLRIFRNVEFHCGNTVFITVFDVEKNKPMAVDRTRNVATNFFLTFESNFNGNKVLPVI